MMKTKFFASIIFFLSISILAQQEPSTVNKNVHGEAIFYHDYLSFFSDKPGFTLLDVFIQVPYKNVQFVKSGEGFTAKYSVSVSIYDSSKTTLIVEKMWNETVNVFDYNTTISRDNYNISKKSLDLKPGSYLIKTILEDLDSRKETISENTIIVKDFTGNFSLSDILLISKIGDEQNNNIVIPNISRNIPSYKDKIKIYFEADSKDTSDTKLTFEYKVTNVENKVIHKVEEVRNIKPGINQILYTMSEFPFELGAYVITVTIMDSQNKVLAITNKTFYSQSKGLPAIILDIDKAIAQTVYIATADELDYMEEGKTQSDRTKRFIEFWKKKDPSPNNDENEVFDEYYRRVEYADKNFSNYIEGWRSDRGMVYIMIGPPNNIERHPFEYDAKPYEVWEYYNLNRSLIFLDQTGFGDYRLITPLTGDLYRYRY